MVQCQRMTGRALLAIRRDDGDIADFACCANEAFKPVREDSVIVGAEDSHLRAVLGGLPLLRNRLGPFEHRQHFADLPFDVGQCLGAKRGARFRT